MRLSSKKLRKALSLFFSAAVMICLTALTAVHACAAVDGGAVSPVKAFTFDTVSIIMAAGIGVLVIAFVVVLILFIKSMKKSGKDAPAPGNYPSPRPMNPQGDYRNRLSKQQTQMPQGFEQNQPARNRSEYPGAAYPGQAPQSYPNNARQEYQPAPQNDWSPVRPDRQPAPQGYPRQDSPFAPQGYQNYGRPDEQPAPQDFAKKDAADFEGTVAADEEFNPSYDWNSTPGAYEKEAPSDDEGTVMADEAIGGFESEAPATKNYERPAPKSNEPEESFAAPAPQSEPVPTPVDFEFMPPQSNPMPQSEPAPAAYPQANAAYMADDSVTTILEEPPVAAPIFVLQRRNGQERFHIDKAEFIIGKERAKVDYCVTNNNSVSRRHAKIRVQSGKCYLSDLGSTNSTYINGTKIAPGQEVALIPGDVIKLSNEEFDFLG